MHPAETVPIQSDCLELHDVVRNAASAKTASWFARQCWWTAAFCGSLPWYRFVEALFFVNSRITHGGKNKRKTTTYYLKRPNIKHFETYLNEKRHSAKLFQNLK